MRAGNQPETIVLHCPDFWRFSMMRGAQAWWAVSRRLVGSLPARHQAERDATQASSHFTNPWL